MTRELIPVGTLVQVTPMSIRERRPYRGIVRGYDMGRTKYHIGDEYMRDLFQERGSSWAFLSEVTPIETDEETPTMASEMYQQLTASPAKQTYTFEVQNLTFEQAMQVLRDFHAKGFKAESVPSRR